MPSFDMYKRMHQNRTCGNEHFMESTDIVEATWYDDPYSTIGYFYDWYQESDAEHKMINNLDPIYNTKKTPIDIKYIVTSSQTYEKDSITYRIQLKPSQEIPKSLCYEERFKNIYGAEFPVGEYCNIQDSKGRWNKWLVVSGANENDPQFPTYEILRCNYIIQYVLDGVKYEIPAVLRSQNSYKL